MDLAKIAEMHRTYYSNRQLENYCSLFTEDIKVISLESGRVLIDGLENLRTGYAKTFEEKTDLKVTLLTEMIHGNIVVNHLAIDGYTEGETFKGIEIIEIIGEKISRKWFVK